LNLGGTSTGAQGVIGSAFDQGRQQQQALYNMPSTVQSANPYAGMQNMNTATIQSNFAPTNPYVSGTPVPGFGTPDAAAAPAPV
jgi:hypothetical protein